MTTFNIRTTAPQYRLWIGWRGERPSWIRRFLVRALFGWVWQREGEPDPFAREEES
jgi:hypothetical protein